MIKHESGRHINYAQVRPFVGGVIFRYWGFGAWIWWFGPRTPAKRIVDSCCPVLAGLGTERRTLEIIIKISPNAEAWLGFAGNLNLISKSLIFKDCELLAHNHGKLFFNFRCADWVDLMLYVSRKNWINSYISVWLISDRRMLVRIRGSEKLHLAWVPYPEQKRLRIMRHFLVWLLY